MQETLLLLVIGHLLGDFVLQSDAVVANKRRLRVLLWHGLVVTLATAAAIGGLPIMVLVLVFASHVAIDGVKVRWMPDRPVWFVVDQALHLAVLILLASQFEHVAWLRRLSGADERLFLVGMTCLGGFLLCVPMGAAVVAEFVRPLTNQFEDHRHEQGLVNGGKYIGWLERSLIFLLVIMHLPEGIGFLFAAKSIFRIGEIKEPGQRKFAEYVIIGTFLSFGWALLAAYLTMEAIEMW